jgi:hypothetical protein
MSLLGRARSRVSADLLCWLGAAALCAICIAAVRSFPARCVTSAPTRVSVHANQSRPLSAARTVARPHRKRVPANAEIDDGVDLRPAAARHSIRPVVNVRLAAWSYVEDYPEALLRAFDLNCSLRV